jgi:hypothetical protein
MLREWEDSLGRFAFAPPALVAEREMQRRTESKFVMPVAAADALLPALTNDYAVLPAGTALVASYLSLYFDTADLEFFHAHRRGRRVRQKVRIRHYPDRRVSFLEVKIRMSDEGTFKMRRQRAYGDNALSSGDLAFVRAHSSVSQALLPQAWIDYRRITLLHLRSLERVTIDVDLGVTRGSCCGRLQDLAVVEVKQSRMDRCTAAMMAIRKAGWRTGWASKYCAGIAFTSPDVRAHRLLEGLRALKAVGTWAT